MTRSGVRSSLWEQRSNLKEQEIVIRIPQRVYRRIENVAQSLSYTSAEEFLHYYFDLNLQVFDVPEE